MTTTTTNMRQTIVRSSASQKCPPCFWNTIEYIKYTYSTVLLLFSITLVMGCIFTGQTKGGVEFNIHPILSFILFWLLISWLAIMGKFLSFIIIF
jgi:hypothetical protein